MQHSQYYCINLLVIIYMTSSLSLWVNFLKIIFKLVVNKNHNADALFKKKKKHC